MMQNGFRRIALAQGLLPARLPLPEAPADVEPTAAQYPGAIEAAHSQLAAGDGDPQTRFPTTA
jgi:hypothetical protein